MDKMLLGTEPVKESTREVNSAWFHLGRYEYQCRLYLNVHLLQLQGYWDRCSHLLKGHYISKCYLDTSSLYPGRENCSSRGYSLSPRIHRLTHRNL